MPQAMDNGKGYVSLDSVQPYNPIAEYAKIYPGSVASLKCFIDVCRRHNIKLVFVYGPELNFEYQKIISNSDSVFALTATIARENNIPYLRNDSLDICKDRSFFWNTNHLNSKGAMIYSAILARQLKHLMPTLSSMPN
jgi:hypothetical protein